MNAEVLLIDGAFLYILVSGLVMFLVKRSIINKLKLLILAPKGAKLFALYRKDGTRDEFVETAKVGGVVEKDGNKHAIKRENVFHDRGLNAPIVPLVEGDLNSIDPFGRASNRVDTKQLRSLFFMEREKAKTDLDPDVKLLKLLVIFSLLATIGALILAYFSYQNIFG